MWNHELPKFVFVGLLNTVLTYFIYLILLSVVDYRFAYSITYVVGIGISYGLNTKLVFNSSFLWAKLLKYPVVYIVQYLVGFFLLHVLVETLKMNAFVAPLFIVILTIPLAFLLSRVIIKS